MQRLWAKNLQCTFSLWTIIISLGAGARGVKITLIAKYSRWGQKATIAILGVVFFWRKEFSKFYTIFDWTFWWWLLIVLHFTQLCAIFTSFVIFPYMDCPNDDGEKERETRNGKWGNRESKIWILSSFKISLHRTLLINSHQKWFQNDRKTVKNECENNFNFSDCKERTTWHGKMSTLHSVQSSPVFNLFLKVSILFFRSVLYHCP